MGEEAQALKRCGLEREALRDGSLTLHCFRPAFASTCLTAGLSLLDVSRLLGHADVAIAAKVTLATSLIARTTDVTR